MPTVRKLAPGEVQSLEDKGKGPRLLTEELYDRLFADFGPGDYGELMHDHDEKRLTATNRLKAAAKRRGLSVSLLRTSGETIRFKVEEKGDQHKLKRVRRERDYQEHPTPIVPALNTPAPKKRGGRPKKVVE